ncbi:MAG: hypothetical protein AAF919_05605 [Pseudomonadota bacterium]
MSFVAALASTMSFALTIVALHTHWPRFGFISNLDLVLAMFLTVLAFGFRKARPLVVIVMGGLAVRAWATTALFGGFISV